MEFMDRSDNTAEYGSLQRERKTISHRRYHMELMNGAVDQNGR
jgi:hypothetical protein